MTLCAPRHRRTTDKAILRNSTLLSKGWTIVIVIVTIFLHLSVIANEAGNTTKEAVVKNKSAFEKLNCTGTFELNQCC